MPWLGRSGYGLGRSCCDQSVTVAGPRRPFRGEGVAGFHARRDEDVAVGRRSADPIDYEVEAVLDVWS
jgi:hypothetical protein